MKYIALLRGINVGGNNTIAMSDLVVTFEKLGCTDVESYINSGNVIFVNDAADSEELVNRIESAILSDFALTIPVVVRTRDQFAAVVAAIPDHWENDKQQKSDVLFLWKAIDSPDLLQQLPINEVDTVSYIPGAVVWNTRKQDILQSAQIELAKTKEYKMMTVRNVNTVRKIWELLSL